MTTSTDRVALDFYETNPKVTRELVNIMGPHFHHASTFFEPCVGDGAIANVIREMVGPRVLTNDIDPSRIADAHGDTGDRQHWQQMFPDSGAMPDFNLSNPPFSEIHRIVPLAVEHARIATIMLLRISHVEPVEKRRDWMLANPMQHRLTTERISFRTSGKGSRTDSVTTEWCIWTADGKPLAGVPVHGWCMWKNPKQVVMQPAA